MGVIAPDAWSEQLAREGRVDFGLSWWRTFKVLSITFGVELLALGIFLAALQTMSLVPLLIFGSTLAVWTPFAVIPHLDQLTSGSPRLYVDSVGIHLARWRQVDIPWDQARGVALFAPNRLLSNPVVYVEPEFFVSYQESLGSVLRWVTAVGARLSGTGFYATPCLKADAWELTEWLDAQVAQRTGRDLSSA